MEKDFRNYLKEIKFEEYLKKLRNILKNKKVVLYGVGSLFQFAKENYDLSFLDVIGVSDMKFYSEEDKKFMDYDVIDVYDIENKQPDYLIVTTLEYKSIIKDFKDEELEDIKIIPMFKKPFLYRLKSFFIEK